MGTKTVINTPFWSRPAAFGPWAQAVCVPAGHDLVFTTGITARDRVGGVFAPRDVGAQAERIFEQMKAVLEAAGATIDDVVKMTAYVADIDDVTTIQDVRNRYWPEEPPASATVEVARLVSKDVRIEIEAVAVIPSAP